MKLDSAPGGPASLLSPLGLEQTDEEWGTKAAFSLSPAGRPGVQQVRQAPPSTQATGQSAW